VQTHGEKDRPLPLGQLADRRPDTGDVARVMRAPICNLGKGRKRARKRPPRRTIRGDGPFEHEILLGAAESKVRHAGDLDGLVRKAVPSGKAIGNDRALDLAGLGIVVRSDRLARDVGGGRVPKSILFLLCSLLAAKMFFLAESTTVRLSGLARNTDRTAICRSDLPILVDSIIF
jgi:hypothetical protein